MGESGRRQRRAAAGEVAFNGTVGSGKKKKRKKKLLKSVDQSESVWGANSWRHHRRVATNALT